MYCAKCESKDFVKLTGASIGPVSGVYGTTKTWTIYKCTECGLNRLVTEEKETGNSNLWKINIPEQ